jgi:uncharacterized iron-regulated protein
MLRILNQTQLTIPQLKGIIMRKTQLFLSVLFLSIIGSFMYFSPASVSAEGNDIPAHNISIRFDLQNHQLIATSRIELPAGMSINLSLDHLYISQTKVNGQVVETDQQEAKSLLFPAADQDQEIIITYSRVFEPGMAPYDLISESGITLTGNWYPIADREMLFKLTVQVPKDFEAISEAEDIVTFMMDDSKQITFRFPHPLYAINFVAGPYVMTEITFGDNKTLAAYFFAEDQQLAAAYLEKARQYLERYEKLLGPYPYNRFSIVENRLPTGFAMPTYTLLGQAVVKLPFIVNTSLGHEVLHAWFGNGVRMDPQQGNWVEGLTIYLADQSYEADKNRGRMYRKDQLVKYKSYVRPEMDLTLGNFSNIDHRNGDSRPRRAVGYIKSSMFFHMLRNKVGHEVFISSLQDFYNRMKYQPAGWSDLKDSFASKTNLDLTDFFDQWLNRPDIPVLHIQQIEISEKEGRPLLTIKLAQQNEEPYELDVKIQVNTTKETITNSFFLNQGTATFEIPLAGVPVELQIDPGYDLMRTLSQEETPPTWSQFLGAKEKVVVLSSDDDQLLFGSLLEELRSVEARILKESEVTDADLSNASLLFFGPDDNRLTSSLFAKVSHPVDGFTLDVRKNPLNHDQVAVLISSASQEQTKPAAIKLKHYGKYSYLHFVDGRAIVKQIADSNMGQKYDLVQLPKGIDTSKSQSFHTILAKLAHYQVVYVGESHTTYEDHKLQLEIIRALHEKDPRLAIGMEMFTRSTQPILDRYLNNEIGEKAFLKESQYFEKWRYDYRLYREIIDFARYNNIPIVALNLEKGIVNQVFKNNGPNALNEEDMALLPEDRKLDMPGYRERIESAYMMHAGQQNGGFSGFLQAQALWDETMAETIVKYIKTNPEKRMVVIVGRGHVNKDTAIPSRVARRLPVSQVVVVNSTGISTEKETADYIFFSSPASLPPFPLLGVMLKDTEDESGAKVIAVKKKGGAEQAGIKENDIIIVVDDEPIERSEDVKIAMLYKEKSDSVLVKIKRKQFLLGDKILEIEVPLARAPKHH